MGINIKLERIKYNTKQNNIQDLISFERSIIYRECFVCRLYWIYIKNLFNTNSNQNFKF